jgi:hypothetical protein
VVVDLAKTSLNLTKTKLNRSQSIQGRRLGVNKDEKKNLEAMMWHVDGLDKKK